MSLLEHLSSPVFARLVITLMHFLWQGTVIALMALITAALIGRRSSNARYLVHVSGLFAMVLCLGVTFLIVKTPVEPLTQKSSPSIAVPSEKDTLVEEPSDVSNFQPVDEPSEATVEAIFEPIVPTETEEPEDVAHSSVNELPVTPAESWPATIASSKDGFSFDWGHYVPHVVGVYFFGVLFMILRLLVAFHGGQRLRSNSEPVTDPSILSLLAKQCRALGLAFAPVIAYCRRVLVPTVVGVIKPTVLLPFSFASALSPEQVEMLLSHELAHIRRHDLLVEVIQRIVEALLFFHPAVWWISRRVRIERENCCDDLVLAAGGKAKAYASSLVDMAEQTLLSSAKSPVAAAKLNAVGPFSQLRQRIARLMRGTEHERMRLKRSWIVGLALVVTACVVVSSLVGGADSVRKKEEAEVKDVETGAEKTEQAGCVFSGRVVDEDGKPVAGVEIFGFVDYILDKAVKEKVYSADDGSFEIRGLQPGENTFIFRKRDMLPELLLREREVVTVRFAREGERKENVEIRMVRPELIKGIVTDENGKPITGAMIDAIFYETSSDNNGHFEVPHVPHIMAMRAKVSAPGYATEDARFRGKADEEWAITLKRGCTVSGRILNAETKEPVEGARIVCPRYEVEGESGKEGRYMLENLRLVRMHYLIRKGNLVKEIEIDCTGGEDLKDFDILLAKGGTITGKMVDKKTGEPLKQAPIFALTHYEFSTETETDDKGFYKLEGLFPGDHSLFPNESYTLQEPGFSKRVVHVESGQVISDVNFEVEIAEPPKLPDPDQPRIAGKVLDTKGRPLSEVRLDLYDEDMPEPRKAVGASLTDVTGEFSLVWAHYQLSPGKRYLIRASHHLYGTKEIGSVTIPEKTKLRTLTIGFEKVVSISGRALDKVGQPVDGARIYVCEKSKAVPRHAGRPWYWDVPDVRRTSTNEEGAFEILGLPKGIYLVAFEHDGCYGDGEDWESGPKVRKGRQIPRIEREIEIKEGGIVQCDFRVNRYEKGFIEGRVIDENGDPVQNHVVQASYKWPRYYERQTTTDREGRFRFENLNRRPDLRNTYLLGLRGKYTGYTRDIPVDSSNLTIKARKRQPIHTKPSFLHAKVVDEDGGPITAFVVESQRLYNPVEYHSDIGEYKEEYGIRNKAKRKITVSSEGYKKKTVEFELTEGETTELTVVMVKGEDEDAEKSPPPHTAEVREAKEAYIWVNEGGPNEGGVYSVAIDPRNPQILYTGGVGGLYKSTDGARSWKQVKTLRENSAMISAYEIAIDPTDSKILYVSAGSGYGLYKSIDAGKSWTLVGKLHGVMEVETIRIDPKNPKNLYVLHYLGGVLKSTDGGWNWEKKNKGLPDERFGRLYLDRNDPQTLLGVTGNKEPICHLTRDGGETWRVLELPFDAYQLKGIRVDLKRKSILYAGTKRDVYYYSDDDGKTWRFYYSAKSDPAGEQTTILSTLETSFLYGVKGGNIRNFDITRVVADPSDSNVMYYPDKYKGVYKTENRGREWALANSGLVMFSARGVACDSNRPGVVYTYAPSGIYRSRDGARTWKRIGDAAWHGCPIATHPTESTIILVARQDDAVISTNEGETWEKIPHVSSEAAPRGFVFDSDEPDNFYVLTSAGIVETTDRGRTWNLRAVDENVDYTGFHFVRNTLADAIYIFSKDEEKILRSVDVGRSWHEIETPDVGGHMGPIQVHPSDPKIVIVAGHYGKFFRSTDAGRTWGEVIVSGNRYSHATNIGMDPRNPDVFYMGYDGEILRTRDGGKTFDKLSKGLPGKRLRGIVVSPADGAVYAGTDGFGVYRLVYKKGVSESEESGKGDAARLLATPEGRARIGRGEVFDNTKPVEIRKDTEKRHRFDEYPYQEERRDGATHVLGTIHGDVVWKVGKSPYVMDENVFVAEDASLTIEPEVVVKVVRLTKYTSFIGAYVGLIIQGKLVAEGTPDAMIEFKAADDTPHHRREWQGIVFYRDCSPGAFKWARVKDAIFGVDAYGPALIAHNIFSKCAVGVYLEGDFTGDVIHNVIVDVSKAINCKGTRSEATITNNILHGAGIRGWYDSTAHADYNIYWSERGRDSKNFYSGIEPGSHDIYMNPGFSDAAREDFSIADSSPAMGAGFDGADIGLFVRGWSDEDARKENEQWLADGARELWRVGLRLEKNDPKEAQAKYEEALKRNVSPFLRDKIRCSLGRSLMLQGEYEGAKEVLGKVIEGSEFPNIRDLARRHLAETLLKSGIPEKSLVVLEEIEWPQSRVWTRSARIRYTAAAGDYDRASEFLEALNEGEINEWFAADRYFRILSDIVSDSLSAGALDAAVAMTKGLEEYPRSEKAAALFMSIAKAARGSRNPELAVEMLKTSLRMNRFSREAPRLLTLLAEILEEDMKNEKEAQEVRLRLCRNYFPYNSYVVRARKKLEMPSLPRSKMILVDRSLEEAYVFTTHPAGDSRYGQYDVLRILADAGYIVHVNDRYRARQNELTPELLERYGLVIINGPYSVEKDKRIDPQAIENLVDYVQEGGCLLVLASRRIRGKGETARYYNTLVSHFGVTFAEDRKLPTQEGTLADLPVFEGLAGFAAPSGVPVDVKEGEVLGSVEEDPVIVLTEFGKGRVVAAGLGYGFMGVALGAEEGEEKEDARNNRELLMRLVSLLLPDDVSESMSEKQTVSTARRQARELSRLREKMETKLPKVRFADAKFEEVINYLSRILGVEIILDEQVREVLTSDARRFRVTVDPPLRNVEFQKLLEIILEPKGLAYTVDGFGIEIVPKDIEGGVAPPNEEEEVPGNAWPPGSEKSKPVSQFGREISELRVSLHEEDGWFVFEIENTETKPVTLCVQYDPERSRFYQFHFNIKYPDGMKLTHGGGSDFILTVNGKVRVGWGQEMPTVEPSPGKDDFIELAPGETLRCKLNPYFMYCPEEPKPGEYELAVRYNNSFSGAEFGYDAVVGVLHAKPLTVTLPRKTRPKFSKVGEWWLFEKSEVMQVVPKEDLEQEIKRIFDRAQEIDKDYRDFLRMKISEMSDEEFIEAYHVMEARKKNEKPGPLEEDERQKLLDKLADSREEMIDELVKLPPLSLRQEAVERRRTLFDDALTRRLVNLGAPAVPLIIEEFKERGVLPQDIIIFHHTREALKELGKPAYDAALEGFETASWLLKLIFIQVLARDPDPAAMELFLKVIKSKTEEDFPLRVIALRWLAKYGGERAIGSQIRALRDPHWVVRQCAIKSLEIIGGPEAVPALEKVVRTDVITHPRIDDKHQLREEANRAILTILGSGKIQTDISIYVEIPPDAPDELKASALSLKYIRRSGDREKEAIIHVKPEPVITQKDMRTLRLREDSRGKARVSYVLDAEAARRFAELTAEAVQNKRPISVNRSVGMRMPVVVGGKVVSAPIVMSTITSGRGMITSDLTKEEALEMFPDLAEEKERSKIEGSLQLEDGKLVF